MTRPPSDLSRGFLLGTLLLTLSAQFIVGLTAWALGAGWLTVGVCMAVTGCMVSVGLLYIGTR